MPLKMPPICVHRVLLLNQPNHKKIPLKPGTHWWQSRMRHGRLCHKQSRPCRLGAVHTGDKVERTFDIRATKINLFRQSRPSWTCSTLATMWTATWSTKSNKLATVYFRQTSNKLVTKSKVSATNRRQSRRSTLSRVLPTVDVVTSVYRALHQMLLRSSAIR